MMELHLINQTDWPEQADIFQFVLDRVPEILPNVHFESVELLLTDDPTIQELNKQYRQKDKPTDVLSFPFESEELLGQIIISVPTAKRQAEHLQQTLEKEIQFLFTHGLLHLLGYDHQEPAEEEEMLTKTYALLDRKQ